MLKLVLSIFVTLAIGVCLLQLRQQRLELNYQTNQLHRRLQNLQTELWNQQLQVAIYTAPNAIEQTVGQPPSAAAVTPMVNVPLTAASADHASDAE